MHTAISLLLHDDIAVIGFSKGSRLITALSVEVSEVTSPSLLHTHSIYIREKEGIGQSKMEGSAWSKISLLLWCKPTKV